MQTTGGRIVLKDGASAPLTVGGDGTLTGVAAVGLMLLRIADPHQRTTAAQAFASRSMVLSPLLGGGIVTATMPLLVMQFGVVPLLVATTVVMLAAWFWPGVSAPSGGSATA